MLGCKEVFTHTLRLTVFIEGTEPIMSHTNPVTIDEMRFMLSAAKTSKILLDKAIAQILTENIERLENKDIKRTTNLYVSNHNGHFQALTQTVQQNIMDTYPMDLWDCAIMLNLQAKIKGIQELYDGLLVAVPKEDRRYF